MGTLADALRNAVGLIVSLDADLIEYAGRSLYIALVSTCLASMAAVPIGILLAERAFRGKRIVVTVLNTLLGVPTVVVGLLVYSFISRQGPLSALGMLFTVPGIITGEVLLILPLITALTLTAVARLDRDVRRTALSLGANEAQALWAVFRESRFGILAAIIAAYGRVVGEVGIATILGGNAAGFTRTLTTAIVLNVEMGYFERALALGLVLLGLSFTLNIAFQLLQGGGRGQ
ncbi:MAG TPA: ABC transporter permease [Candidatus Hydrogenedentes bacterium]|nr:ABC transporter permease [Candidatus Hydrogenedentota bacterium]HPG68912.1 ABC transporter permease [Candidatus Hydrogenedentota bacterium]